MVLTSEENGLSAPITFDTIRSQSLPVVRAEGTPEYDIIRVSLRTAVQFIADLERREEEAFPHLGRSAIDQSLGPGTDNESFAWTGADEWVDEIMRQAEELGANNVSELTCVAWNMKVEQRGDSCSPLEFENFSSI